MVVSVAGVWRSVPLATLLESQKQLLEAARYVVLRALLLGLVGAVLPWN
jgi:hypothetical protein